MSDVVRFAPIVTGDQNVDRVQEEVSAAFQQIGTNTLLNGALIEDVEITSGSAEDVPHGLNRAWRGYIVVKRSAGGDIYDETSPDDRRFIRLQASADVTISLWVF